MDSRHEHLKENVAAYALEALDAAEIPALEAHLRTCKSCRADLEAYRRVAGSLLSALPPQAPPSSVRRDLQRRFAPIPGPRSRPISFWRELAIAGAVTLLVALNIFSVVQLRSVQRQQAELESQRRTTETVMAMLAYPSTQPVAFEQDGISGSLLVDKQRNLLGLFAWHLPPAPAGKVYQMWLIDSKGDRTSGGFLVPETGYPFVSTVIQSSAPLTDFTGLGVTTEPIGGSAGPTGPRVFSVDF